MPKWTNWSGRHVARPKHLHHCRSEDDAMAVVAAANSSGRTIRVAGTGHSHAALVPTDDTVLDLSGLSGVIEVDGTRKTALVRAGTPVHALGRPLHDAGLGLINQGDIDRQTIAGATATGTHGTGRGLKNLSASVIGATLILASGKRLTCNAQHHPQMWQAARLNLGAIGVITQLQLQLRGAYKLEEKSWQESFASILPRVSELAAGSRHFEFFWSPRDDQVFAKTIDETSADPGYPLADEGARRAWSYEVFPSHRPHLHTEMEYSVPEEDGAACLSAIRALILKDFPDLTWPVEYRTLASDDVWLSTACDRQSATISVHQTIDADEEPLYRACEKIFLAFGGRPHWGKVHYLDGTQLAALHPKWADWWAVRDRLDPQGIFLNDLMQSLRPG